MKKSIIILAISVAVTFGCSFVFGDAFGHPELLFED